jgi:hypothetical protein
LVAFVMLLAGSTGQVHAGIVTYTWVTDFTVPAGAPTPTSATFQVDLATVQSGSFGQFDIQNISFSFPGIDPLTFTTGSSIGFDNAAFVDTTTGLPIFHDANQGLAVIAYHDMLFGDVFLSILFDNPSGVGVDDTFNAINGGPGSLGFGYGHWIDSGYAPPSSSVVPEPTPITLLGIGIGALGLIGLGCRWRRRYLAV